MKNNKIEGTEADKYSVAKILENLKEKKQEPLITNKKELNQKQKALFDKLKSKTENEAKKITNRVFDTVDWSINRDSDKIGHYKIRIYTDDKKHISIISSSENEKIIVKDWRQDIENENHDAIVNYLEEVVSKFEEAEAIADGYPANAYYNGRTISLTGSRERSTAAWTLFMLMSNSEYWEREKKWRYENSPEGRAEEERKRREYFNSPEWKEIAKKRDEQQKQNEKATNAVYKELRKYKKAFLELSVWGAGGDGFTGGGLIVTCDGKVIKYSTDCTSDILETDPYIKTIYEFEKEKFNEFKENIIKNYWNIKEQSDMICDAGWTVCINNNGKKKVFENTDHYGLIKKELSKLIGSEKLKYE